MTRAQSIKRVGILFSGGPAPAANAVISAATLNFLNSGISVIGFFDGYENLERYSPDERLVEGEHYACLRRDDVSQIRNRKDIVLRTSRANPGKMVASLEDLADSQKSAKLRRVYDAFDALEIDALVSIGGDDTLKTANYLHRMQELDPGLRRLAVVHLPKTIDNDYFGIDWTFGFFSAAHFAAAEIRNLGADARSTRVWYVLEIMGRKAGWLTYAAGIAGEATRMLSVEDFDGVFDVRATAQELVDLLRARERDGRRHGIVCVAEGLADILPDEQRPTVTDEHGNIQLGSAHIGKMLAEEMERLYVEQTGTSVKVRHKQIGYESRCAEPSAYDVLLGTQLGVGAHRALIAEGLAGHMVSVERQFELKYVPFDELIDPETLKTRVRLIERDSDLYRLARSLEYQKTDHPEPEC
ncbi:MAG: 6-phosphofructokinase [Coriobacteriia bacterium]|jgi:6-phosphofructokinase 1|nr:6-phosphofructokinase [Coriobacteriia bacterium]